MEYQCEKCKYSTYYRTGREEYPPCTTVPCCSKGHWEGDDQLEAEGGDPWSDCIDFKNKDIQTPAL